MMDRLLAGMLNWTVTMMIALLAGAGLSVAYMGAVEFLAPHLLAGTIDFTIASALSLAAATLVRHRNELMDR